MKIATRVEVKKEVFDKYQDVLKSELRANVSKELMKHNVFIATNCSRVCVGRFINENF